MIVRELSPCTRSKEIHMVKLKALDERYDSDSAPLTIGHRCIGSGFPVYIVAEIGINHNGSLEAALSLINVAIQAGCDAVKFQKRSPDHCVPTEQRSVERDTPWGRMPYIDYRHRMEFGLEEFNTIDAYCKKNGIAWFASCWDLPSVDFIKQYDPICYKIASACLTDDDLLCHINKQEKTVVLSTGMSTMQEIRQAVSMIDRKRLLLVHTTSNYQGNPEELNLSMIHTLQEEFDCSVGYSGHEEGLIATMATIPLGTCYVERHITLDRNMWGSDHGISLEPRELNTMVRDIRLVEKAMGDGIKRVYESERDTLAKLRSR